MALINRNFFSPEDVEIMEAAIDRAWHILEENGIGAKEEQDARLILAKGAVRAARWGERDVVPLSYAACRYWVTYAASAGPRASGGKRPRTLH